MIETTETAISGKKNFAFVPDGLPGSQATGYLVLGQDKAVLAVNPQYLDFHSLYAGTEIRHNDLLSHDQLKGYPEIFTDRLQQVLDGKLRDSQFELQHLGEQASSFKIAIQQLEEKEHNVNGAYIMIEKAAEQVLQLQVAQDEQFYQLLVDTSTTVYQLADAAMMYVYTSKAIEPTLGYRPQQLTGKNVIELVHPDDREVVKDWLIEIRRHPGKLLGVEYRIKNCKGDYLWIENNARNMLADERIRGVVMNFKNIQAKKIANNALVQAEQRLSLLLNNTAESFIIVNSRLRIMTYNKAAQDKSPFFYNKDLQSGFSVLDLVNKNEVNEYIGIFEEVFTGKEVERESRFTDGNNELHIYNHTFRPLFDTQEDIFGVFITSTDITERKKLTEELAKHSERLKAAQQIARLGYFELDFSSGGVYCSELFYEILDISVPVQEWKDIQHFTNNIHHDDRDKAIEAVTGSMTNHKEFNIEFRYKSGNGDDKVIFAVGTTESDESGKAGKFRITLQDITDSKMALLALQTLESRFKSLFENSVDGVMITIESGQILSANPAACQILGYAAGELGKLQRGDYLDVNTPAVQNMINTRIEKGAFIGELAVRHKNGHYFPAEVTSILLKDANDVPYISTIFRDITEKKKVQAEQQALTEELLKHNQDLQQFSFITSHNLRAPVANLLSLLSLYNKDNHADPFNEVLVQKFEEATFQLNQTLNDLIDVLVIKSNNNIERELLNLQTIYDNVFKNVENLLAERDGRIEVNFGEITSVSYNRIHLESIFLNMITNAVRYSSPDRSPLISISSYFDEDWIVIAFADNGLGMDLKRYGDRLFGLYQRFHGHKEGKGLGLYMTRSQIVAMGGKIEVDSEPDKGTTFRIYLKP